MVYKAEWLSSHNISRQNSSSDGLWKLIQIIWLPCILSHARYGCFLANSDVTCESTKHSTGWYLLPQPVQHLFSVTQLLDHCQLYSHSLGSSEHVFRHSSLDQSVYRTQLLSVPTRQCPLILHLPNVFDLWFFRVPTNMAKDIPSHLEGAMLKKDTIRLIKASECHQTQESYPKFFP